jgi:hypothetical protein
MFAKEYVALRFTETICGHEHIYAAALQVCEDVHVKIKIAMNVSY